jgi:hypothetical protein
VPKRKNRKERSFRPPGKRDEMRPLSGQEGADFFALSQIQNLSRDYHPFFLAAEGKRMSSLQGAKRKGADQQQNCNVPYWRESGNRCAYLTTGNIDGVQNSTHYVHTNRQNIRTSQGGSEATILFERSSDHARGVVRGIPGTPPPISTPS